jgi:hypothetical protein
MAEFVRGRAHKVFLEAVEVRFLSPRCQDDAHAPRLRLTINVMKWAWKGGHAESTSVSRRVELCMGRHTNALRNRRDEQQAYVGYWLGPKGHGERLDILTHDLGGIPKYPGEQCGPKHNDKQLPGTE